MRLRESALLALVVAAALLSRRPARRSAGPGSPRDVALGYERSDASPTWIAIGGIALLVALGGVLVVATSFGAYVTGIPVTVGRPPDLVNRLTPAPTPPAPRLEPQEGQDFSVYHAAAEQRLSTYAWVDRQAGVVRIPVDRAMAIVAQQGLPGRPTSAARDDGAHLPSYASSGRVAERSLP